MTIVIQHINLHGEQHGNDLLTLLNNYACDPMGGGSALPLYTQQNLIKQLQKRSDYIGLIAYQGKNAIALLNAFEGFSSFAAQPLINIHDLYVAPAQRGQAVLELLFDELEKIAKQRKCCKLTLEVLSNNQRAKSAYKKIGFSAYELSSDAGHAIFWQKKIL